MMRKRWWWAPTPTSASALYIKTGTGGGGRHNYAVPMDENVRVLLASGNFALLKGLKNQKRASTLAFDFGLLFN